MYFTATEIAQAREMDLLTYLQTFEPFNLVHVSGNTYCTKEHDSLKISNGKWHWFSRRTGGRSALDYLIKVKEIPFTDAVAIMLGKKIPQKEHFPKRAGVSVPKIADDTAIAFRYLSQRGIDPEIIEFCADRGLILQDAKYGNVIFARYDENGTMRYAAYRSTKGTSKGELSGSDKSFSFSLQGNDSEEELHIFESAIDSLSFLTMEKLTGHNWRSFNTLSLGGVYASETGDLSLPKGLEQYIKDHPQLRKISIHFDNDSVGRSAAVSLASVLEKQYEVKDVIPKYGKDVNDELIQRNKLRRSVQWDR